MKQASRHAPPPAPVGFTPSLWSGVLDSLEDAVLIVDTRSPRFPVVYANKTFRLLRAGQRPLAKAHSLFKLLDDAPGAPLATLLRDAVARGRGASAETTLTSGADSRIPVSLRFVPLEETSPETLALVVLRDIREKKYAEEENRVARNNLDLLVAELTKRALHDRLTGLPNRFYFERNLQALLAEADRSGLMTAFVLLDLDNFKTINDTFGHLAGDHALVGVADGLGSQLRPGETLVRWGGDEFLWIIPGLSSAAPLSDRFVSALGAVARVGPPIPTATPLSVSIGYALYPDDGRDMDELLRRADRALYRVKHEGKNCWAHVEGAPRPDLPGPEFDSLAPVFGTVRDLRTGEPVLLLAHPGQPDESGETTTLLTRAALTDGLRPLYEKFCDASLPALRRHRETHPALRIAFPLHPLLLKDDFLLRRVADLCAHHGVPTDAVIFRLTNPAVLNDKDCLNRLRTLRDRGFKTALKGLGDDTPLSSLCRTPFDYLMTAPALPDEPDRERTDKLFASLLLLAESFGAGLIVTGVTQGRDESRLRALGVRLVAEKGPPVATP